MNQQLIIWSSELVLILFIVSAFFVFVAANIYDIIQIRTRKKERKSLSRFRGDKRPFITVLVYARNNNKLIENCLKSIKRNRYLHYDVVVVDDLSSDDTKKIVGNFKQKYPIFPLRLYSKRQHGGRVKSLVQGYNRSQKGSLIFIIDATSIIHSTFLRDAAVKFVYNNKIKALNFNIYSNNLQSITLIYHRFQKLNQSLFKKFYSLFSINKLSIYQNGTMYRKSFFSSKNNSSDISGSYVSNMVISDNKVIDDITAISQLLNVNNLFRLIIVIITVLLQTYSMYMAATLQTKTLLIIGWLSMAVWVLLVIWSSETVNIRNKIKLSFCAPVIYFLVYAQLILCLIKFVITTILSLGQLKDYLQSRNFVKFLI